MSDTKVPHPPTCKKCRSDDVKALVMKPEIVYWWCSKCGAISGESLDRRDTENIRDNA